MAPLGTVRWKPSATSRRRGDRPKRTSSCGSWGLAPPPAASLSLFSPGRWAGLCCPPADAGQGPLHRTLSNPDPPPAAAMARLAAVLWSLCITAVLVTSATQGRCRWGWGGAPPPERSWAGTGRGAASPRELAKGRPAPPRSGARKRSGTKPEEDLVIAPPPNLAPLRAPRTGPSPPAQGSQGSWSLGRGLWPPGTQTGLPGEPVLLCLGRVAFSVITSLRLSLGRRLN